MVRPQSEKVSAGPICRKELLYLRYDNVGGRNNDKCGIHDPEKLINPRSKIDGSTPELRETIFLSRSRKLQNRVVILKSREDYWRPNVIRQSLGQILAEDLHGWHHP